MATHEAKELEDKRRLFENVIEISRNSKITQELENKRRLFEEAIEIARKEGEAYFARCAKPILNC